MGTAAPSKPCSAPSRPFEKHGHQRSCFTTVLLIVPGGGRGPSTKTTTSSTLMQLILLQDWQRVLIRATLFPREISKPSLVHLYGVSWKLLPLHLACALQPPPKVVRALMFEGSTSIAVERRPSSRLLKRLAALKLRHLSSLRRRAVIDDCKQKLLLSSSVGSQLDLEHDDDGFSLDSATTESTRWNGVEKHAYHRSNVHQKYPVYHSKGSLVSFEQSIGDMTSYASTNNTNGLLEISMGGNANIVVRSNVALQLTDMGGILPMPVLPSKDARSLSPTNSSLGGFTVMKPPLLQAAAEAKVLLPIHLACLYQASPPVLHLLLQEHPMGALSAVMGMLPIHLVCAGWTLEPLETGNSGAVRTALDLDDGDARVKKYIPDLVQVLVRSLPESATARSANHGMTPQDYLEQGGNKLGDPIKDKCIDILTGAHDFRPASCMENEYEIGNDINVPAIEVEPATKADRTSFVPSEIHCLSMTSSSSSDTLPIPPPSPLYSKLLERDWSSAMALVDTAAAMVHEWQYGMDQDLEEPVLWKRLALHLACSVAAPVGLVEMILYRFPNASGLADPHIGSLPLHLACQYGCSLEVVRLLLQHRPDTTKAIDVKGRLALHYAILAAAPYSIIEILVQHDPASVLCPDQEGKTPLQYAQHSYPKGSHVLGLLELVWM